MQAIIRHCTLPTSGVHHDHPWHQMVIALSGQAEFEIAGHGGRVDAMHGCLVPAGEVHFYEGTGDNRHVVLDHYNPDSAELERLFDRPRYFTADASLRLLLSFIDQEESLWQGSTIGGRGYGPGHHFQSASTPFRSHAASACGVAASESAATG